jgi:hypothetical protein
MNQNFMLKKSLHFIIIVLSLNCFTLGQAEIAEDPLISVDLHPELAKYDGKIKISETGETTVTDDCEVKRVVIEGRDPVTQGIEVISFFSYVPKKANSKILGKILIEPPTGGITLLDKAFAKSFCMAGAETALLETWTGYEESEKIDFGVHDRASIRAIFAGSVKYQAEVRSESAIIDNFGKLKSHLSLIKAGTHRNISQLTCTK